MTLPSTVLFPQAMLPLYIFEDRYRKMLADVLSSHRLFAVVALDVEAARDPDQFEPPCRAGAIGMIRASHKNDDGTSNLILQGLARVTVDGIIQEDPYRTIKVTPIQTERDETEGSFKNRRLQLMDLFRQKQTLGGRVPEDVLKFLRRISDPEAFLDLAAYALLEETVQKQRLLREASLSKRFTTFEQQIQKDMKALQILKDFQQEGPEGDEDSNN
ncbi:MAG: LON peptidase substrate-binding domain-containing protein [Opitutales bacterium]